MKCEMCHTEIKPNDLVCVRCGLLVPNRPLPDDITASPAVHATTPLKPALDEPSPVDELVEALAGLVDRYVCNKGTGGEFIACITPKHASAMTDYERSNNEVWKLWDNARAALARARSKGGV